MGKASCVTGRRHEGRLVHLDAGSNGRQAECGDSRRGSCRREGTRGVVLDLFIASKEAVDLHAAHLAVQAGASTLKKSKSAQKPLRQILLTYYGPRGATFVF